MKKQAVNTFEGGMVTDIDELHAKSSTLTYARNTEYLTTEGNQLILQKREGREINASASVSPGFNIKAVEVMDDISYIISTSAPGEEVGNLIDIQFSTDLQDRTYGEGNFGVRVGQYFDVTLFEQAKVTGASFYVKNNNVGSTYSLRAVLFGVDGIESNGFVLEKTLLGTSDTISSSTMSTSYDYVTFTFPTEIEISSYNNVVIAVETITGGDTSLQYTDDESVYPEGYMVYGGVASNSLSIDYTSTKSYKCRLIGSFVTLGDSEIGTFPSPDYSSTSSVTEDEIVDMIDVYSPLKNFREYASPLDENYTSEFRTSELDIGANDDVDIELQKTYDGSVNIVFASTDNPVRLINTKFKSNGDGTATLIKRRLEKNDNVYSGSEFQKTEIIPRTTTVGYISNVEVLEGGSLPAGGYRYYFKYITADGVETDVIEESRTIDIHFSNSVNMATGGESGEIMPKMVKIELADLDSAFKGIRVYFSVTAGDTAVSTTLYQIENTYDISASGTASVMHTGFENTIDADSSTFALSYAQIKDSKIIAKVNNRLALSGSSASLNHKDEYADLATNFLITSFTSTAKVAAPINIEGSDEDTLTHANPTSFYDLGEYWDAETYEFGVVFLTSDGSTPVYPIQGLDKVKDTGASYDWSMLGETYDGFDSTRGQNCKGVYRTEDVEQYFKVSGTTMKFKTVHLKILTTFFQAAISSASAGQDFDDIIGYYFVRKKRKKDAQMRGLLCPTIALPQVSAFGFDNILHTPVFTNGGRPGVDSILNAGYKRVPYPDNIMPYACRAQRKFPDNDTTLERLWDFQNRTPITVAGHEYSFKSSYAFYSPDVDCNTATAASTFSARDFGTHIYKPFYMRSGTNKELYYGSNFNNSGIYLHNTWTRPTTSDTEGIWLERRGVGTFSYVYENTLGAGTGAFAGSTDRNLWLYSESSKNGGYDLTTFSNQEIYEMSNDDSIGIYYNINVDDDEKEIAGNALKYGRYLGIKFKMEAWIRDLDLPEMHMDVAVRSSGALNINLDYTCAEDAPTSGSEMPDYFSANVITGYLCKVYQGVNTSPLSYDNWVDKYETDDNSKYFAVSRRYPIGYSGDEINIGDGDCYSGLMWKRVFRPRGIDEAPQATDTSAYKEDSRDVGMADFGYAISVPTKSNYNFHLRVPSNMDDAEYEMFGEKRSFLPVQGKDSIRGAKMDETDKFNQGYGAHYESVVPIYRLNSDAPYYKAEQPNRVYVSDTDIESNFVNGFTQFKGLSYRDYNSELGPINAMVTYRGKLVAIFDSGVATIGVDERSMIPGSEGDIFMDSAKALASKSEVKSTVLGSNQPKSVVVTGNFVYGVDTKQYKVWRTNGTDFKIISDLRVQSWIKDAVEAVNTDISDKFIVFTTYDARKSELLFSFSSYDAFGVLLDSRTIVFNEMLDVWVCETDEHRSHMFYVEEDKYAVRPDSENSIYDYSPDYFINKFYTEPVDKSIVEFVINQDQQDIKVLENLMIVGNSVLPEKIYYTTDIYGGRTTNTFLEQDITSRTPITLQIMTDVNFTNSGVYSIILAETLNSIQHPLTGLPIDVDTLITLEDGEGNVIRTKIIDLSVDGTEVTFAHDISGLVEDTLIIYLGHINDQRLYNTEIHEGVTYIVPSCKLNYNITQPRGKWVKVRLEVEGADQVYISGIGSVYNQSLS